MGVIAMSQPKPHDGPLRWLVPSRSNPDESHLVQLNAYGVNGRCSCPDFTCRHEPALKQNPRLGGVDKTRCRHIRLVRQHFMDRLIGELSKTVTVICLLWSASMPAAPTEAFLDALAWTESRNNPEALGDYSWGQPNARGAYQQHLGSWADADAVRAAKGLPRACWVAGTRCPVTSRAYAATYLEILEGRIKAAGLQPTADRLWLAWTMGFSNAKAIGFKMADAPPSKRRGWERLKTHLNGKPSTK